MPDIDCANARKGGYCQGVAVTDPFTLAEEGCYRMQPHTTSKNRSIIYALVGFILGIGAPFAWTVIRLILFPDPAQALWQQIFSDIT